MDGRYKSTEGKAETDEVAPARRVAVAPIRHATAPRIAVPTTTAKHAVGAG